MLIWTNLIALQQHNLHDKSSEVCINGRSPAALQPFIGLVTEQTTVKWPIYKILSEKGFFVGSFSAIAKENRVKF